MDARVWYSPRPRAGRDGQDGFTLIEVIIALVLLTVVLMAGGGFMIRTITTSSALTGRQGAVTVANQVMEQIRAVDPTFNTTTGISPLVYGRGKSDVVNQWTALSSLGIDVSDTYTGSGVTTFDAATYQTTGTPTVPLQQTISLGGQAYTVDALIGTCVRPLLVGSACGTDPLAVGDELFRAVVRVTWTPGAGRDCSRSQCSYMVSTLIDPTADPVFNANRKPVANPDTATVATGGHVDIGVTVNDSGDFALAGSVTILSGPSNGSTSLSNNIITYTPTSGYSGVDLLTYTVTDTTGRTSNSTTVTIKVTPVAVNDTAVTTPGAGAVSVSVLGNDRGTSLSLVSVSGATIGTAAVSGSTIKYTPPTAASGTDTVTYTGQDSSGQQYTGTLTVTVKPIAASVGTAAVCWPGWVTSAASRTSSITLSTSAFTGTGPFTLGSTALLSGPTGASVSSSGRTLTYTLPASAAVPQRITYTITDANSVVSDPITMNLKGTCP